MKAADAQMSEYQKQKKEQAKAVFARVASENDNGLLDTCITGWYRALEEAKAQGESEKQMAAEAERVKQMMKDQKAKSRGVLERSVGDSVTGTYTTTFRTWCAFVADEKKEREMLE